MKFIHLFRWALFSLPSKQMLRINVAAKRKWIMRINLVIIIMTAFLMQVSAFSFAQRITLKENNITLKRAFSEIKKQTGYIVLCKSELLNRAKPLKLNLMNAPLEDALRSMLNGQNLEFSIEDKSIVIKEKEEPSIIQKIVDYFVNIDVVGKIVDENGEPIAGATIKVKGLGINTTTGNEGRFSFKNISEDAVLEISSIGFKTRDIKASKDLGIIKLEISIGNLSEVSVISTGYQTLPKERATGSFVLIDSTLLSRRVSTNILDRLDGVTSGLIFNKTRIGGTPAISIRGRSTIASNTDPLIILDNFPYDGDISNINPQDVKSISILKDGAAASIWGSRAGNGVIVITTYKGNFNQKPIISFNANVTIGDKPDLYYKEQLTNQEFIGVEQFLFDKGAYNSIINNGYGSLSPAVEIMLARRKGTITTDQERNEMLDALASHDNRSDLDQYVYRKSVNQQYQLNVNGGGQNNKYYISMGYDKNLANTVVNSNDRLTLNANNTLLLFTNKLELYTGILFSSGSRDQNGINYLPKYPYEKIADENGNPLVTTDGALRIPYADTAGKGKLLDWHYRPLEEIQNSYSSSMAQLTDYRFNLGVNYKIISGLRFSVNYSYDKGFTETSNYNTMESYATRDQINTKTQISPASIVTYPIPLGDIVRNALDSYFSHYGRGQFNYNNTFNKRHEISAIAGFEIKDYQSSFSSIGLYGYNRETQSNSNSAINPTALYKNYYNSSSSRISLNISNVGSIDRYRSYYFNGSYSYDSKYIVSISARKDESNLFGVKTNQKGVPLWSTGLAWNLSREDFYKFDLVPYLKLRATYGYNGNVDKSVSAYLTAQASGRINYWNQGFIDVQNPPNPSLRWEKVKNINIGFDFAMKNNIITGSLDYWIKDGIDLIGTSPIAPQTGVAIFTGNSANMHGQGIDLSLNFKNLITKNFKWLSTFLFNYTTDKITSYKVKPLTNGDIVNGNYQQPLEGYSFYSVFSFPWRGLNNQGNPQSVLNGETSIDYNNISSSFNPNDLVYSGTLLPKVHGNFLNTFSWKAIEVSINLLYRFNYVYRRKSLANGLLYASNPSGAIAFQQPDYKLRWRNPGDEASTDVPALIYPVNSRLNNVYSGSSILIEKGDHIRLQDIRINYNLLNKESKKAFFSNLDLYVYASNLGVVWKASKYDIDPDNPTGVPISKMLAVGFKANF